VSLKTITSALISVHNKSGLEPLVLRMHELGITLYSTGGTQEYITSLGIPIIPVETLTGYPSILGGRVKTLHPGIFGPILWRRDDAGDEAEMKQHGLSSIDCVVVDLYPFEDTVLSGASGEEIIEQIDVGGISLIRAAAKNFRDVVVVPSRGHYPAFLSILNDHDGQTDQSKRRELAREAFDITSHYDSAIYKWLLDGQTGSLKISEARCSELRYGENPHQRGLFYGDLSKVFSQLGGKELSYNNLLDADSANALIDEFKTDEPTFAILKHNNACGIATRTNIREAYLAAIAADPVSAFGGVLVSNTPIDEDTARDIHSLFFEIIIAPAFTDEAHALLKSRPNRIILQRNETLLSSIQVRTLLNGFLVQDKDLRSEAISELTCATNHAAAEGQLTDLIFANKVAKHTKSNAIVLVKNNRLLASGTGQASRVDALRQAIDKARSFKMDLNGAVMASDAFFPFPDCVEIADKAGISAIIQPGGSIKDQLSVDYCNAHGMAMYMTGMRHFRH
jgi:phosphoribosylaminoimidazolecarboxamide formyltransferase / IMP cyclohydrolase